MKIKIDFDIPEIDTREQLVKKILEIVGREIPNVKMNVLTYPPKAIILADNNFASCNWLRFSDSPVDIEVFDKENFRLNSDHDWPEVYGVDKIFKHLAIQHGVPYGYMPEYLQEMMELLKEKPMPCTSYDFWDFADESGWTLAHQAALFDHLPEDFNQWDLQDSTGQTVADVVKLREGNSQAPARPKMSL